MSNVIPLRPTQPLVHPVTKGDLKHSKHINILSKIAVSVEPVAQARIAASIVYRNEIISVGVCQRKTHPFQAQYGKNKDCIFLHAETDAIKNAVKLLNLDELAKSTLYVCRVKFEDYSKKKFLFGMAKPCSGCARAIANFNISKVVYSLDNEGYQIL